MPKIWNGSPRPWRIVATQKDVKLIDRDDNEIADLNSVEDAELIMQFANESLEDTV